MMLAQAEDKARSERMGLAGRVPVYAIELSHPDVADDIRIVNDSQRVIVSGETYTALPFRINLPDENDDQVPRATAEVDNVNDEFTTWMGTTLGGRKATLAIREIVITDAATRQGEVTWEIEGMEVGNASLRINRTVSTFSVEFVSPSTLENQAVKIRHDSAESPGLH